MQSDTATEEIELLTAQQVADALGVPVSTIYRWRSAGSGPVGIRVGKHLRYSAADVRAWLDELRASPAAR